MLILTAHARPANLRAALDAHVAGFLAKDTSARELIAAIRTIAAGGRVVDPDAAIAAISTRPSPLTARETEVLRLHAKGANPRDIANTLFLSYGTVRNYLPRRPTSSAHETAPTRQSSRANEAGSSPDQLQVQSRTSGRSSKCSRT